MDSERPATSPMKKAELVFIPSSGIGHLIPTIKFATQLLERDDRFSVTILVMSSSLSDQTFNTERIRYVNLPLVDPPPPELFSKSVEKYISVWMERHKPQVKDAIINHVLSATNPPPLAGLVLDLFTSSMVDVGKELGVPSYIFLTCGAAFLGFMWYIETRHRQVPVEFDASEPDSIIQGFIHPVPTGVLPSFVFNKEGGYSSMVEHAQKFREADGIIINTFSELEPHALSSISGVGAPPIYTVGPMLDLKNEHRPSSGEDQKREIMSWLDKQPPSSVVLLCFGSRGSFNPPQVREIAEGLEKSGKRFIWSLRRPRRGYKLEGSSELAEFVEILPEGFSERTRDKGIVCGWVPQVDVLGHEAVGGFVSHCGWNSTLESIWFGVPMAAWPLDAEQQLNAFELVRDLGMAVEVKMDYRKDSGEVVSAEEINRAVRSVMENNSELRKKMKQISEESRRALSGGGSSYVSLGKLTDDMSANIS